MTTFEKFGLLFIPSFCHTDEIGKMEIDLNKSLLINFRLIKSFDTNVCAKAYYEHVEFIKQAYEARDSKKVVVVTHFLPARECIAPKWRGPNPINDYFANDLGDYISEMTDTTWLFGHTHDATDIMLGDTRIVCNPHGYYNSNEIGNNGFDPFKVIEL